LLPIVGCGCRFRVTTGKTEMAMDGAYRYTAIESIMPVNVVMLLMLQL